MQLEIHKMLPATLSLFLAMSRTVQYIFISVFQHVEQFHLDR